MTSKYGFSVVAPMSVIVPSSTCGRSASCWALLKRWISSMNRTVGAAALVDPLACPAIDAAHVGDAAHDRRQRRRTARRRRRPAAAPASSCPSPADPTGPSTRGGRARSSGAARHARRRVPLADELVERLGAACARRAGARRRAGIGGGSAGERSRHPGVRQVRVESRPATQAMAGRGRPLGYHRPTVHRP